MAEQKPPSGAEEGAAANVARAAAGIHRSSPSGKGGTRRGPAERVARAYFAALNEHDLDAALALWAAGAAEAVRDPSGGAGPTSARAVLGELLRAIPDLRFEVLGTTAQGERCAVRWRLIGTFAGPGRLAGIAPTGHRVELEGIDLLQVRGGLIGGNDPFMDTMALVRQIGLVPPRSSGAEQTLTGAFNARTHLRGLLQGGPRRVAAGVWVLQGQPGRCNVYLIENERSEGGVTLFDAGGRMMVRAVATAGARLGGVRRVILGHGHTSHRGSAPGLHAPVLCHPEEVTDAEGSGGFRYWPADLAGLPAPQRQLHRILHRSVWDGGPVRIAGTLKAGDEVAGGFRVVHLPGHAPGLIALWRQSDRLALASDCFRTVDLWGRDAPAGLPERVYDFDSAAARESLRELASLRPAAAWPGHGSPVRGEVGRVLREAAEGA